MLSPAIRWQWGDHTLLYAHLPGTAGAPVVSLGGVFPGGMPIGGPLTQIFRGGGGPLPPTLFGSTVTPAGPIGGFFVGTGGSPIGVPLFEAGGLPFGAPLPIQQVAAELQARTVGIGASLGLLPSPVVTFGPGGGPIGAPAVGGVGSGGASIGP